MIGRLIYRLKQFYFGMFARYQPKDEAFAKNFLSREEIALFHQLPPFEKKHAVVVARKMLDIANEEHPELDQRKLARLGLLHDIGKIVEHNTVLTKSFLVILRFLFPQLYEDLARRGERDLRWRRFYIHKRHGAVGAALLERIGESSEILMMIKKHDPRVEPFGPEDPVELKILQAADSTY